MTPNFFKPLYLSVRLEDLHRYHVCNNVSYEIYKHDFSSYQIS
jgi:hypothetical protein